MPEENLNQPINQAPEQADPFYKETLLLYNEQNGAVEAVSELKQDGRQYKAITTSPLTANKPAFFDLRNSSAVGAFIKGFLSQENAKPFHFLKVAADKASEVAQSLLRLADNPKDPEGLKALNDHRVTSFQLERVKFDTQDLHLQELKEMGVVVTPKELEAMKLGLPTTELHNINLKVGDLSVAGEFALRPFRDLNGDVQVGLESALARPEFEREEFRMMFTASDKEQMLSGKTPDRLYEMPNPHTGEKEWCYVTLNPATNRFVTVPRREVPELRFFNGVRLTDAQQENLASGSRVQVEGCTMRNGDITYSGKVGFDALTREYRMTDYRYSKPSIPESLSKQLDERQLGRREESRRSRLFEGEGPPDSRTQRQAAFVHHPAQSPDQRRGLRLHEPAPSGAAGLPDKTVGAETALEAGTGARDAEPGPETLMPHDDGTTRSNVVQRAPPAVSRGAAPFAAPLPTDDRAAQPVGIRGLQPES